MTLIFVLVFVLAIGLILSSLASMAATNVLNANNVASQRSLEYAADNAMTVAVQTVRYSGNPFSPSDPVPCMTAPVMTNSDPIQVYCEQQYSGSSVRKIEFFACLEASVPCSSTNSLVIAHVTFNDAAPGMVPDCTYGTGPISTCGTSMTVDSWLVGTADH